MKMENLNDALQVLAAKFCANLVRPHYMLYFALGILLTFLVYKLGIQLSPEHMHLFIKYVAPPIVLFMTIQGHFVCSYFYKEKYRILVPHDPLSRGSFGIPGSDNTFYETITANIGLTRKIAGYIYALSKPITFTVLGFTLTLILIELYLGK